MKQERLAGSVLCATDQPYPAQLPQRLGPAAPAQLHLLGPARLLALPKTALFCSAHCPGAAILAAYDQAAHWRALNRCVISGFHSPMEQECLRILLRGTSPVIVCLARGLPRRLPPNWHRPLAEQRLLVVSAFAEATRRATIELARARNQIVAALAEEHYFAHIAPGSQTATLAQQVAAWQHPPD